MKDSLAGNCWVSRSSGWKGWTGGWTGSMGASLGINTGHWKPTETSLSTIAVTCADPHDDHLHAAPESNPEYRAIRQPPLGMTFFPRRVTLVHASHVAMATNYMFINRYRYHPDSTLASLSDEYIHSIMTPSSSPLVALVHPLFCSRHPHYSADIRASVNR